MLALFCILVFVASVQSKCTETVTTPEAWTQALTDILNGVDRNVCADADLLIRVDEMKVTDTPPDGIHQYANYWTWVAGPASMDEYIQTARGIAAKGGTQEVMREDLLVAIQSWVGQDNPGYNHDKKYYLYVISKSATNGASAQDYDVFSPKWDTLFTYLQSFVMCKFTGTTETCDTANPLSITFDPAVQETLKTQLQTQITGCRKGFWTCGEDDTDGCSPEFCEMRKELSDKRNEGGQALVAEYYMQNQGGKTAAQARAFFDIGIGATFLFTGNGTAHNGFFETGAEFISRGDTPIAIENPQGARFKILPYP